MTRLAEVTTGDVGRERVVQLGTYDTADVFTPTDYTGVVSSVVADVRYRGGPASVLAAAFTDAATGQLTVQMGDAGEWLPTLTFTEETRDYDIEYQVTFVSGDVETTAGDVLPVRSAIN